VFVLRASGSATTAAAPPLAVLQGVRSSQSGYTLVLFLITFSEWGTCAATAL